MEFEFEAELWEWMGKGSWHFITLPVDYAEVIKASSGSMKKGFGSVRVETTVGKSTWRTSIFPDSKSGSYLLPVKLSVRRDNNLETGQQVSLALRVIDL